MLNSWRKWPILFGLAGRQLVIVACGLASPASAIFSLIVIIIFLAVPMSGAWATPTEDASTRIEEGMTVDEVSKATGFRPNVVEEKTCGGSDTIPIWSCRVQTYSDGAHMLIVYFHKLDDRPVRKLNERPTWVVHSWFVR